MVTIKFLLVLFLSLLQICREVLPLSPNQCLSFNSEPGGCVSFEMCPPFLRMIKDHPHNSDNIRLLQKLTCGFEKEEPLICCPANKIVYEETYPWISSKGPTSNPSVVSVSTNPTPELKPAAEVTPQFGGEIHPQPEPVTQNPSPPQPQPSAEPGEDFGEEGLGPLDPNNDKMIGDPRLKLKYQNLINHPNFNLLPPLKECSNSVDIERIVGGADAPLGAYPWMARIGYRSEATGEIEFYCGGTIINKRYILTASHCTEEIDYEELTPVLVRVGEHNINTTEDCSPNIGCTKYIDYRIEKIIPHEYYSREGNDKANDIGLIRVNRDISFGSFEVQPICLPFPVEYGIADTWKTAFSPSKNRAFVTGWGRTKWNKAEGSIILQEVQLPVIPNAKCQESYATKITLTDKQMCAGGVKDTDSCGGDSGSPLQFPISVGQQGKLFQLGIVSFGPVQCGVGRLPGVYTRVSAYRQWILDNMRP